MVLILGSKGILGQALMKVFGNEAEGFDREEVDVTDFQTLKNRLVKLGGELTAVINCVAYNDVDGAEEEMDLALKLNAEVPKHLAVICKDLGVPFVHFSTNYVFDGEKGEYSESDLPNPISNYAKSKYQGELWVTKACEKYYLVRTSVLFGENGQSRSSKRSFISLMLDLAKKEKEIKVITDEINTVTYSVDLAWAVRVLLSQKFAYGIYHLTNSGSASWYDLAKETFVLSNLNVKLVSVLSSAFPRKAKRPKKSVLLNTKFIEFRHWKEALREFLS